MTGTGMLRRALRAAVIATVWCIAGITPAAAAAPAPAAEAPTPKPAPAPPPAAPQPVPQLAPPAVIGMQLEPPVLDPTVNPAAAIAEALDGNLYEGLVKFAPDGSVLPALAQSWEISGDGLTYVFHLRAGVRFHDGVAFDAAAAQFSLERALAADSSNPQRTRINAIGSVRVIDDHTLVLSLSRRSGGLLQSLAWAAFVMVEPKSAATNSTRPIGTGPFRFRSWSRGDSLTLERNPDYWGGPATIGGVTFRFISDPTAAYAALMAGDVDAFSNYPAPESFPQFAADRRFKVFVGSTESETVLAMNNRHAPARRPQGAARDRPRHRSGGRHRRRDVRVRHPHRQPLSAPQSGLRRSHGAVSA